MVGEGRGGGGRHDRGAAQDMRSAAARSGEVSTGAALTEGRYYDFRIFANQAFKQIVSNTKVKF